MEKNRQVIVIDDALSLEHNEHFRHRHFCESEVEWGRWITEGNQPKYIDGLIKIASKYMDLEKVAGYEWWTQKNTYTQKGWHIDYDEGKMGTEDTLVTPMFSMIYYPLVAHIQGGEFTLEDMKIPAKTNRLIILSANEVHTIGPYNIDNATRWSFLINPWTYKPEVTIPSFHLKEQDPNVDNSTNIVHKRLKEQDPRNSEA